MRAMFDAAVLSSSWLTGFTVCLSLIASIGAQNLYVLRQAVQGEHVRACVAWCVASDALLVALGVAGMARLLAGAPTLALWLAWHRALFAADAGPRADGARVARGWLGVVGGLAVITLFNPHVYLDTVLLIGSIGARHEGALKWIFVLGAACASLTWFALLAWAGRRLQGLFARPRAWRLLDGLTGAMMLLLAWWVWQGT